MLKLSRIVSKANEVIFHRQLTTRYPKPLKFIPLPEPQPKTPGGKIQKTSDTVELNDETLELLQRLSLVGFEKEEVVKIVKEAITFAEKIFEVDTTKIKPLVSVLEDEAVYFREDVPDLDVTRDEILSNSKVTQENYFVSPIGNDEAKFAVSRPRIQEVNKN